MKKNLLILLVLLFNIIETKAQINFNDQGTERSSNPVVLTRGALASGRYSFTGNSDFSGTDYTILFQNSRWEMLYNGGSGNQLNYFNTNASAPFPPSLNFNSISGGGWSSQGAGGDVITLLSGDVQDALSAVTAPTVTTTTPATNILATTVTAGGNVTANGGETLTAKGVVYGTSANPVIGGSGVVEGTTTVGAFSVSLTGLSASTTYHYRAYATNSIGTTYGADQSFSTAPIITVTSPTLTTGQVGTAFSSNFTASGGSAPYNFSLTTGPLPAGITVGMGGSLSGTPTESGSFPLTVTATDQSSYTGTVSFTLVISPAAPTVTGVTSSTLNSSYKSGNAISIQVNFSAAVTVTGTPQLQLETGTTDHIISYSSGSGTSALTFNYTVQAGDITADLDYLNTTALTLNGGTISTGGTNAILTLPAPGTAGSLGANKDLVIDGLSPTVTTTTPAAAITATTATLAGSVSNAGQSAVTDKGIVYSTIGNPTISDTKVPNGTPTGIGAISVSATSLSSGTTYHFRAYATNTQGTAYGDDVTFTTAATPTITTTTPATNILANSATVGGNVTADGGATLTAKGVVYGTSANPVIGGSGVVEGTTTTGAFTVSVTGLTKSTTYHYRAYATNSAGTSYGADQTFTTRTPIVVTGITSSGDGTYKVGTNIGIRVFFSGAVTVTGTPQLQLETGTTDQIIDYVQAGFSNSLIFYYAVQAGDFTSDLDYLSTTALTLNGGTIKATSDGLDADLTLAPPGTVSFSLASNNNIIIDTQAPTLAITSSVSSLKVGETATITFTFSEDPGSTFTWNGTTGDVSVSGGTLGAISGTGLTRTATFTPTASTNNGTASITVAASAYTDPVGNNGGAGTTPSLTFDTQAPTTTVATAAFSGDTGTSSTDFITKTAAQTISGALSASLVSGELVEVSLDNGGTYNTAITFLGDNAWSRTTTLSSGSNTLIIRVKDLAGNTSTAFSQAYVLDTTAPSVLTVNSSSNNGTYKVGNSITIGVNFSEAITVTGTPTLTLNTGATVNYTSTSGTEARFAYTVGTGENSSDLDYAATTSLSLNGGTIKDAAGNEAVLTFVTPGTTGSLSNNADIVIDTQAPTNTIATASLSADNGSSSTDFITNTAAQTISGTLNANLAVDETLQASINNGNNYYNVTASAGTNTWSVSFTLSGSNTFKIRIIDAAGNTGTEYSQAYVIDTTVPNVPVVLLPATGATVLTSTPVISGTAEANSTVTINIDNNDITNVITNGSGNWTYTPSSAVTNATHTVKALSTDVAGNASSYGTANTFTVNYNPTMTYTSGSLVAMSATYGYTSTQVSSFTVAGTNLIDGITVTPPTEFEVSADNNIYINTITVGAAGTFSSVPVYIRLRAGMPASQAITGNIVLSSTTATSVNVPVPGSSISAAALTVTADVKSKRFGEADPAFTYSITSGALVNSDDFTGALTRLPGEDVAVYTIALGTLSAGSNYSLTYLGADLTISRKALTITADNKVRLQNTANPALTVSYTGFANNETSAVLTAQPVLSTTATVSSPQGDYPIVVSGASATNYTITYVNGTLKVSPGVPTSISLTAATVFENQPAGTLAATFASTSDDPDATFTYSLVGGAGDADNASFSISGNKLVTVTQLDYEQKSSYTVRIRSTTQYGLSLDQTFAISLSDVNEAPTIAAIANQAICYINKQQLINLAGISAGAENNQTVTLTATSSNASLLAGFTVTGTTFSYLAAPGTSGTTTITITAKDNGGIANGGTDTFSRSFDITVNALPDITIFASLGTELSNGLTETLTASGGVTYSWANADGIISGQTSSTLTIRPDVTTTYTVTATNASGCKEQKSITINVLNDFRAITATNIMSPNGDGINDKWVIENIDKYPNNEVKVFDRAGRVVFSKKGYTNTWDATINGSPLAEDTYFYIVDFGPELLKMKGFITIVKD